MENGELRMEPQRQRESPKGKEGIRIYDLRLIDGLDCIMENGEWRMENGKWNHRPEGQRGN